MWQQLWLDPMADTTTETRKLDGKVAIVTGAGSSGPGFGTGKATSVLFARAGAKVVLVDMYPDRAAETLRLIEAEGGQATTAIADLSDPSAAQQVVDKAVSDFGTVDILVNNAAIAEWGDILNTSLELYQRTIAVNLTAPFMLSKTVIPLMLRAGGGSIINITSIVAIRGTGAQQPAYAASKAGLIGLMTNLADTFGKQGIRVNAIAPGLIKTPMRDAVVQKVGPEMRKVDLAERTALGQEGDAWDVARAALFLAGPDGRYITGVHLPVDGGTTMRTHY
jgi:NAD(P)-dependent dehydrogenase (short-subunit alcohol dehydrogenase family)